VVLNFLLEDVRAQLDLGFAWLYEEYSFMQGFNRMPPFLKQEQNPEYNYNKLLCAMAGNLIERAEMKGRPQVRNGDLGLQFLPTEYSE